MGGCVTQERWEVITTTAPNCTTQSQVTNESYVITKCEMKSPHTLQGYILIFSFASSEKPSIKRTHFTSTAPNGCTCSKVAW